MKKLVLAGLAVTFFSAVIFAQQTTPTPSKPENDVVRISTTLIQIDATVTDKKGNVVTGLTADDFEIYENGELQKITNLSFVNLQPPKTSEGGLVKEDKDAPKVPDVPMRLRPDQVRRTFALVVDDLSLSFASINAVRDSLKKFVAEQMQPGDLVAIVRTGSGLGALQQFTSDKNLLYAAIDKIKFRLDGRNLKISAFDPIRPTMKQDYNSSMFTIGTSEVDPGGNAEGAKEDERFDVELAEFNDDVFAVGTLGAFDYIIRVMNDLPGRKAAILFSEGFDLYKLTSSGTREANPRILSAVKALSEIANRSSVVVYTVDPRGLVAPGAQADDTFVGMRDNVNMTGISDALRMREEKLSETQQSLEYLARETGGFSYLNQNDISYGVSKVMDDQRGYYLIGYEPDSDTFDPKKNKYNKLEVKLKRPDLKIRYRDGFFAKTDSDIKRTPKTPEEMMLNSLISPFTRNEINIKLTSYFADRPKTGSVVETVVHVDADNLKFTEEKDGWQKISFEVLAVLFGENGYIADMTNRVETIKLKGPGVEEIRRKGLIYSLAVPVKFPGGYQMHFVLRDMNNQKIGSANQYIEIPDLSKKRLTLSGVALRGIQNDEIINAAQTGKQLEMTLRQFRPGSTLQFVFDIYNAKAKSQLTTRYRLLRNNREVFRSDETPLSFTGQSELQTLNAGGAFTIDKSVPPGEYILQVIVKDPSASKKYQLATQWIDFEVIK